MDNSSSNVHTRTIPSSARSTPVAESLAPDLLRKRLPQAEDISPEPPDSDAPLQSEEPQDTAGSMDAAAEAPGEATGEAAMSSTEAETSMSSATTAASAANWMAPVGLGLGIVAAATRGNGDAGAGANTPQPPTGDSADAGTGAGDDSHGQTPPSTAGENGPSIPMPPQLEAIGAGYGRPGLDGTALPHVNGRGGISVSGLAPGAEWAFSTDGGQTWNPGVGTDISASQLAEGLNTVQVMQVDQAGQQSAPAVIELVKDTVAPNLPVMDILGGVSIAGGSTPTINGQGEVRISGLEGDAHWAFSRDGGQTWTPGVGEHISAGQLAEGPNTIQVVQIDTAGNWSQPSEIEVIKDATAAPPSVTSVMTTLNEYVTPSGHPLNGVLSLSDLDFDRSEFHLVFGKPFAHKSLIAHAHSVKAISADAVSVWITAFDGTHTIAVRLEFSTLYSGPVSAVRMNAAIADGVVDPNFDWDTAGTPAPGASYPGHDGQGVNWLSIALKSEVTVEGLEAGATWEYSTDGGVNWTPGQGTSLSLKGLQGTSETVQIVQIDPLGNRSEATVIHRDGTPAKTLSGAFQGENGLSVPDDFVGAAIGLLSDEVVTALSGDSATPVHESPTPWVSAGGALVDLPQVPAVLPV